MAKHTPGPWFATENGQYVRKVDIPGRWPDWNICEVNLDAAPDNGETGKANARLIAAAPELLETLEELLSVACRLPDIRRNESDVMKQARKVITKVKGE